MNENNYNLPDNEHYVDAIIDITLKIDNCLDEIRGYVDDHMGICADDVSFRDVYRAKKVLADLILIKKYIQKYS